MYLYRIGQKTFEPRILSKSRPLGSVIMLKSDFMSYLWGESTQIIMPFSVYKKSLFYKSEKLLNIFVEGTKIAVTAHIIEGRNYKGYTSLLEEKQSSNRIFWLNEPLKALERTRRITREKELLISYQLKPQPTAYRNKFVVTGGPGFGKSTLIAELARRGYGVSSEAARRVIEQQMRQPEPLLPWLDRIGFDREVVRLLQADYSTSSLNSPHFFDRGFPDLLGWRQFAHVSAADVERWPYLYPYERIAFIARPWKEIYVQDEYRPFSFSQSVQIGNILTETYQSLGYRVIELPNVPVNERADFVLDAIEYMK